MSSIASQYDNDNALNEVCGQYGWKIETLRRRLREFKQYEKNFQINYGAEVIFKPGHEIEYLDYPIIEGDAIVISDIEMPDQFALMLRLAVFMGMARSIKKLLIVGDVIALDMPSLTRWVQTWLASNKNLEAVLDEDLYAALNEMSRWFDEIYITEANHDIRLAKATQGQLHLGMLLHHIPKVQYSRYEYMYLKTPRGFVKLVHPRNFAQDPIVLGEQIYSVEQGPHFDYLDPIGSMLKCHIVVAHCHRQQSSMSPDSAMEIHSLGTMRHPHKTEYYMKGTTKLKKWDIGFLVIDKGFFDPMRLNGTNWLKELGGHDGLYSLVKDELEFVLYPKVA